MYVFDFGFDVFKKICVLDKAKLIFQEYNINVKTIFNIHSLDNNIISITLFLGLVLYLDHVSSFGS